MKLFLERVLSYNHFRLGDKMKVLLVSPPLIGEGMAESRFYDKFHDDFAREVSMELGEQFGKLAEAYGVLFFDSADVVVASKEDSLHLDAENQRKLGRAIFENIYRDLL